MQTTDPTVHHDANEMARMIYFVSKAIGNENEIGKKTARKTLLKENRLQQQLSKFGGDFSESTLRSGEELLCALYSPKECFAQAHDVRNYLFCLKNNNSEKLPLTVDNLGHHNTQANYQTCVWKQAILSMVTLPLPDGNGYKLEEDSLVPVLMSKYSAPKSIIELTTRHYSFSMCLELFLLSE